MTLDLGKRRNWNFNKYALAHKEQHDIIEKLMDHIISIWNNLKGTFYTVPRTELNRTKISSLRDFSTKFFLYYK